MDGKEELYRRLEQVQRHISSVNDAVTKDRMIALISELHEQIVAAEKRDANAPPILLGRRQ